jgi:hypothetical protein
MFWNIVIKTAVVHTFTYFLVGFTAFTIFKYATSLSHPKSYMRPATDPLVRAGVFFQPIRGVLFGLVFYLLKVVLFQAANGWLIMWVMLVVVGILSTFAPAASSIEGFVYMKPGLGTNWGGMVEVLTQSLLLSIITCFWVNHPEIALLNWVLGTLFAISILLPLLGLLAGKQRAEKDAV